MSKPVQNVVFDLEGTLVDSAPVFVEVLNAMFADRGSMRRVTETEIGPFASLGGPALVSGVLADECGDLRAEVDDFRARYRLYPIPFESLYEGVAEGVKELCAHGFRLAICSNKPQALCEKVIADLGLTDHFPVIVGSSPDRMTKPAPDLMDMVMAGLGTTVHDCLYVGDSEIDQALAKATGVRFAFVTYGYATEQFNAGEQTEFSRFSDLVLWIKTERATLHAAYHRRHAPHRTYRQRPTAKPAADRRDRRERLAGPCHARPAARCAGRCVWNSCRVLRIAAR